MSQQDSQEQDCTIYVQELKSDNAEMKLNAATKIGIIANTLGFNRIRDELIPYLIEIVEQMDNDTEFLIKVADGIYSISDMCTDFNKLSVLLEPLRILASLDQPPVRSQAIKWLKTLPDLAISVNSPTGRPTKAAKKEFIQKYYIPLIKNFSTAPTYSPKVTAAALVPVAYPEVQEDQKDELRGIMKRLALVDGSPLVKRAVAEELIDYSRMVSQQIRRQQIMEIWQKFIVDSIDIIRIKALETASEVAKAFSKEEVASQFIKPIIKVEKKSWRVRYSLVESITSIIDQIPKETVRAQLVPAYEELLKDPQTQVRSIALLRLHLICQAIGPDESYQLFFQYMEKASKDGTKEAASTLKLTLTQAILQYLATLNMKDVINHGLPLLQALVKDDNITIRTKMLENLADKAPNIFDRTNSKLLLPLLESCIVDKKWRFRLELCQGLSKLLPSISYADSKEFLTKLLNLYFKDHNLVVRDKVIQLLKSFKTTQYAETEVFLELVNKHFNNQLNDANYVYRATACRMLESIADVLDQKKLEELLTTLMAKMDNEKASSVLITYLNSLQILKPLVPASMRKSVAAQADKILKNSQDEDVQYFATKVISND